MVTKTCVHCGAEFEAVEFHFGGGQNGSRELCDRCAELDKGLQLEKAGKSDEAIAVYQSVIEMDPTFADAWNNLGVAYWRNKDTDNSLDALQRAADLAPADWEVRKNLGIACVAKGDHGQAIEAFMKAIELKADDMNLWKYLGVSMEKLGRLAEAAYCYQEAFELGMPPAQGWAQEIVDQGIEPQSPFG